MFGNRKTEKKTIMKKLKILLMALMLVVLPAVFLTACSGESVKFTFKQGSITIQEGQKYDPFSFIKETLKDDVKEKITFKIADKTIAIINADNEIETVGAGMTELSANVGGKKVCTSALIVEKQKMPLSSPVNIHYDEAKHALVWNPVFVEDANGVFTATTYKIQLTANGNTTEVSNNNFACEYFIDKMGTYSVKVKTVGNSSFADSAYSSEYTFSITSAPSDLVYDNESNTLSWNANGNGANVSYIVHYDINGNVGQLDPTNQTSCTLPSLNVGKHSVFVESVSTEEGWFGNTSQRISLTKLSSPTLNFNNGLLTWNAVDGADDYMLEITATNFSKNVPLTATSYTFTNLAEGEYTAKLTAQSEERYVFSSPSSELVFTKLPTAILTFDLSTKTFTVENGVGENYKINVQLENTGNVNTINNQKYTWDIGDYDVRVISAQIVAKNPSIQMDGDIATTFSVNGTSNLSKMQNLKAPELYYAEENGEALLKFTAITAGCAYTASLNGEALNAPYDNGKIAVGSVSELYAGQDNFEYQMSISKPVANGTYYLSAVSNLNVSKLAMPTALGFNADRTKVVSLGGASESIVVSEIEYKINEEGGAYDLNLTDGTLDTSKNAWNVKVKLYASDYNELLGGVKTYYTSSDVATFDIVRLDAPQNFAYSYTNKKFTFDSVENASIYKLNILGQTYTTSVTEYSYNVTENATIKVVAEPNFAEIQRGGLGYYTSLETACDVFHTAQVSEFKLSKDPLDGRVFASWTEPSNTAGFEFDIEYQVYVDGNLKITTAETSYKFDASEFLTAKTYEITLKILSPNHDFSVPMASPSLQITKLAAPVEVNRNIDSNILRVQGFASSQMSNVVVNGKRIAENSTSKTFELVLNEGESKTYEIYFEGIFDSSISKYYLNSSALTFSVTKLQSLTSLDLEITDSGNVFTWTSLDKATFGENVRFAYYTSTSGQISNVQTIEETSKTIASLEPFTFFVQEVAQNPNWTSITENNSVFFLNSDNTLSFEVKKEASFADMEVVVSDSSVKFLWNYEKVSDLENYAPKFVFELTPENSTTISMTLDESDCALTTSENGKNYALELPISYFVNAGDYALSAYATSTKTLDGDKVNATITKLQSVQFVAIQETTELDADGNNISKIWFVGSEIGEPLSLEGVKNIQVSGGITYNGLETALSLEDLSTSLSLSVKLLGKNLASEVVGNHYYLNSEEVTFTFQKVSAVDCLTSADKITWDNASVPSGVDFEYNLRFAFDGGEWNKLASALSENFISLSDSRLTTTFENAGEYDIKVKTTLNKVKTVYSKDYGTIFASSNFGNAKTIVKLETPNAPSIIATDEAQNNIQISWDAVSLAEKYNIEITLPSGEVKSYAGISGLTFETTTDFVSAGTYKVKVQATADGKISSAYSSETQISRLDKATSLAVSGEYLVTYGVSTFANAFAGNFTFALEILKANGEVGSTIRDIAERNIDISSDTFLSGFNDGAYGLQITLVGDGETTLTSEKIKITAYKFLMPEISIVENSITITSSDKDLCSFAEIWFEVKDDSKNLVALQKYTSPYAIPQDFVAPFTVSAFVKAASATAESQNFTLSNNGELEIAERLDSPDEYDYIYIEVLDSNSEDFIDEFEPTYITQHRIHVCWDEVLNADYYEVYINNELAITTTMSWHNFENAFDEAGIYEIRVVARAYQDYVTSLPSEIYKIIRLDPIANAYIDADGMAHFTPSSQSPYFGGYYFETQVPTAFGYLTQEHEVVVDNTINSYYGVLENLLKNDPTFTSGEFALEIRACGAEADYGAMYIYSPDETLVLTSAPLIIYAYKLATPTLNVEADHMTMAFAEPTFIFNGSQVSASSKNYVSVTKDSASVLSNLDLTSGSYYYPNSWESGEYTFTYQSKPKSGVQNVVSSDIGTHTATRLDAVKDVYFARETLADSSNYSSDEVISTYLNSQTYLKFTGDSRALAYNFTANSISIASADNTEKFIVSDDFEALLNYGSAGTKTLSIVSLASGGEFINSPKATISYITQSTVENFKTSSGLMTWASSGSTNTSAYLVRAVNTEEQGLYKYWQSNGKVYSTGLTGILDNLPSGQINLNIKALGNLTDTANTTITPILDSPYLQEDQTFTKLMTTSNVGAHLGYLCFDKVEGASYYMATFNDGTSAPKSYRLMDFSQALGFSSETQIVAEISSSARLVENVLYEVTIQAYSTNSKVIASDHSEAINVKKLANANVQSDITLSMDNANGDLSKKQFAVYATAGSYGLMLKNGNTYTASMLNSVPAERTKVYITFSVLTGGGNISYEFASIGSSQKESGGFYWLTSAYTQSPNFYILAQPEISINVDTINWTSIERADGYYLYINGNQYKQNGNVLLRDNFLVVPSEYGGINSTSLDIRVIAVSADANTIFSPEARYAHTFAIGSDKYSDDINLQKIQIPDNLSVEDGALVFGGGVSSLDSYNQTAFETILDNMTTNPSRETFAAFENYLATLFNSSSMIFSPYTGFNISDFTISMTNTYTGANYVFDIDGKYLLKFTESQLENFVSIVNLSKEALNTLSNTYSISYNSSKALYTGTNRTYSSENEYLGYYVRHLRNLFQNSGISEVLSHAQSGEFGYPSIRVLLEELSTQTSVIVGGEYDLCILQKGNTMDWLSSNYTDLQKIYVPFAPTELHIKEVEGDFMLVWNAVSIPVSTYEAVIDENTTSTDTVYIIYGETSSGKRYELLRTVGLPTGTDGQLMASLSDLVDNEILLPSMTKIFVASAGDFENVVIGRKSNILDVTVLPQLTPYMKNGVLNWNSLVSAFDYEIITKDSLSTTRLVLSETNWIGDDLTPSTKYALSLRALGAITQNEAGENVYVISGRVFECELTKLATMDVGVNKFGIFEWVKIPNALGFTVDIENTDSHYIVNSPNATTYEAVDEGFNTFCFRALGSNNNLMKEGENYFMSSRINDDVGINGHMLSSVDGVFVEDGYLKWIPLTNDKSNNPEGELVKTMGYRLALNKDVEDIYTTELTTQNINNQVDNAGNFFFDFTTYGTAGTYVLNLQTYLYFESRAQDYLTNAYITNGGQTYHQLLGAPFELEFKKATPPTNLKIQNGELVWSSAESLQYFVEIYLASTNTLIKEYKLTEKSWWTDEDTNSQELVYKAKIKTYQENTVFSGYAELVDLYSRTVKFGKMPTPNVEVNTYSGETGNFIEFEYPQSGLNVGFNIMYKPNGSETAEYVLVSDETYADIVTYKNGTCTIDIAAMNANIKTMTYHIQVVPLGNTAYLKSNWSTEEFSYATPDALANVYFDSENAEYYWPCQYQDKNSTSENSECFGYVVRDELYSGENLVATYYYNIAAGVQNTNLEYFAVKSILGKDTPCIVFSPVVTGYTHKVSVAVSLNPGAEQTLMSFYTECETTFNNNLFKTTNDIFASGSELFSKYTSQTRLEYLTQNAYGSSQNPFILNSSNFDNLNKRLTKYTYLNNYTVVYDNNGSDVTIKVADSANTLYFVLESSVSNASNMIGERTEAQGVVNIKPFANVLDGKDYTVTYSIKAQYDQDNLGLFRIIGAKGIVKNLSLNATIDFNALANSSQTAGGLAGENYGTVSNIKLKTFTLKNLQGTYVNGLSDLTLGGIVGINYAKVEYSITESTATISTKEDGVTTSIISTLYMGGIVGKNDTSGSVSRSGNNASLVAVGVTTYAGGVAAYNNGSIAQTYNKGALSLSTTNASPVVNAGGIVGLNDTRGTVESSYNTMQIAFTTANPSSVSIGGLVGYSYNYNIKNSFSTSSAVQVSSSYQGGSLFGRFATSFTSSSYVNYYFSSPFISNNTSLSAFATNASGMTLNALTTALNQGAGESVFRAVTSIPTFVWE